MGESLAIHLTKTTRDFDTLGGMQSPLSRQIPPTITQDTAELASGSELDLLRDVLKLLPTGVTLPDEEGRFLLINDAGASQLGLASGQHDEIAAKQLGARQEAGLKSLRAGRAAVSEVGVV